MTTTIYNEQLNNTNCMYCTCISLYIICWPAHGPQIRVEQTNLSETSNFVVSRVSQIPVVYGFLYLDNQKFIHANKCSGHFGFIWHFVSCYNAHWWQDVHIAYMYIMLLRVHVHCTSSDSKLNESTKVLNPRRSCIDQSSFYTCMHELIILTS